jgi:hypothetical protein
LPNSPPPPLRLTGIRFLTRCLPLLSFSLRPDRRPLAPELGATTSMPGATPSSLLRSGIKIHGCTFPTAGATPPLLSVPTDAAVPSPPLRASLIGICRALSIYQGLVRLELDCLGTVNALKASSPDITSSCFVIEEVKRILSLFQGSRVSFCHRSANEVAHVLS